MDNKPTINRELLIPILIGAISLVGVLIVLLMGRVLNAPAEMTMTPSPTPFEFLFLGTEPAASTPLIEGSEIPPQFEETPIRTPVIQETRAVSPAIQPTRLLGTPSPVSLGTLQIIPTRNVTNTPPLIVLRTDTATVVPTLPPNTPVDVNTYDDMDPRLTYSGGWINQTGVAGAHEGTLHISDTTGNSVTFQFIGQEVQLFYQAGSSLGTVTISFDNETLATPVNQGQGNGVWSYLLPTAGVHGVTITHTSGGSVNIDKLVIPPPPATPTRTASP